MKNKEQLQDFFLFFADLYKKPTSEFWKTVQDKDFEFYLAEALHLHDCTLNITKPKSFEELKREYEKLFLPIKKQFVPLEESYYKPWTIDTTATVSFTNQKGYFMGDAAWHLKYLLEQLNMDNLGSSGYMPDHLSIILELSAIFIEDEKKFHMFCQSHLDWLDDFLLKIKSVTASSFYLDMTELLKLFVSSIQTNKKEDYVC